LTALAPSKKPKARVNGASMVNKFFNPGRDSPKPKVQSISLILS